MRAISAILLISISVSAALAAEKRIKFEGEACSFTARVDPAKYSEAKVRAALDAVYTPPTTPFGGMYESPQSVAEFDINAHRQQCTEAIAKAEKIETLGIPEVEAYRTAQIASVKEVCAYEAIRYRAAKGEGAALKEFEPAAGKCARYSDALEGKTDLEAAWRASVEESCKNNSSVRQCRARAEADKAKPDGRERARLHVLGYGWNNCAINTMKINAGPSSKVAETARKKLDAVLKVRTGQCEEP